MNNTYGKVVWGLICATIVSISFQGVSQAGKNLTGEEIMNLATQGQNRAEMEKLKEKEREETAREAATNETFRFMLNCTNMSDKTLWAVIEKPFPEDVPLSKAYEKPECDIDSEMNIDYLLCQTDIWQEGKRG